MPRGWPGALTGIVAPPRCGACASPCPAGSPLCPGCSAELGRLPGLVEPGPPGIEVARAVGPYEGVVREIVVGLKFGRRLPLAGVAAAAMARLRPEEPPSEIVPVPAAPLRRLWRGFDPAEEIALALSAATGAPLSDGLRRTQGPRQMGRRRAARLSRGPVVRLRRSPPERALLVDDVHTTGATLAACAGALRDGGCRSVAALTLARA